MGRLSFQDEIAQNKRSSILLLLVVSATLILLVYILVYLLAPEYAIIALPFSVFLIMVYSYSSYRYGDKVVLSSTNAKLAEGREYQYLRDTVEGLSIASGIPPPKIFVIESNEINAFATGRDPENASIAFTNGLLKELDRLEQEGVIAHEISHIRNRDILFMTLVAVLVGLSAIISHIILRTFRFGGIRSGQRGRRERRGGGIEAVILMAGLILAIFAPIITRLVQFAVSRRREYLADASGIELTRYPEGLASALDKIISKNRGKMNVSEALSHLFFVDPNRSSLDSLYATHPPIEERIRRLRSM